MSLKKQGIKYIEVKGLLGLLFLLNLKVTCITVFLLISRV